MARYLRFVQALALLSLGCGRVAGEEIAAASPRADVEPADDVASDDADLVTADAARDTERPPIIIPDTGVADTTPLTFDAPGSCSTWQGPAVPCGEGQFCGYAGKVDTTKICSGEINAFSTSEYYQCGAIWCQLQGAQTWWCQYGDAGSYHPLRNWEDVGPPPDGMPTRCHEQMPAVGPLPPPDLAAT